MSRNLRLPSPALVVAVVALFVALSGAAAAGTIVVSRQAAAPAERVSQSTSLTRRVAVLERKVKTLQKQAAVTQSVVGALTFWSVCSAAVTADALQGTWLTIDQLSAATQAGRTYFGPQTPVDDTVAGAHACNVARVARPGQVRVPPTITPFISLLRVLR
jgi:cell division protein FtsB